MAQNDDFSAALSRAEGATTTALSGIARQIQQLADELATDRAPTQAQIDRLNAVAASLEDASVRLAADDPTAPTP
jgi:phage-related tail protein